MRTPTTFPGKKLLVWRVQCSLHIYIPFLKHQSRLIGIRAKLFGFELFLSLPLPNNQIPLSLSYWRLVKPEKNIANHFNDIRRVEINPRPIDPRQNTAMVGPLCFMLRTDGRGSVRITLR